MRTRTLSASPAAIAALKLKIFELFPPRPPKEKPKAGPPKPKSKAPAKRKTAAEIAIEKAREGWIRTHNARLKKARVALRKRIEIAREARRSRDGVFGKS